MVRVLHILVQSLACFVRSNFSLITRLILFLPCTLRIGPFGTFSNIEHGLDCERIILKFGSCSRVQKDKCLSGSY